MSEGWQFWIDRGGTFTDVVARSPQGRIILHKLLSENEDDQKDATIRGIEDILKEDRTSIQDADISSVRMGTTVGTNALLERTGARVLLVTNRGFGDLLRIGYQNRPRLFDLNIVLPEMAYEEVLEVGGRLDADGNELEPLDEGIKEGLKDAYDRGFRSLAIVLMHAYREGGHERSIASIASDIGFRQISASCEVSPLMKIVGRGDTTVVDSYLSPLLERYIEEVRRGLHNYTDLLFMQSNGGLIDHSLFRGKDCILSGPAGGIVGAVRTSAGYDRIITFDMGGTSTDVSLFDGKFERTFESEVASFRIRAPMLDIHTVAAGGGSILHFDGARYTVGPDSAGASPGPACYRNGGPLTITDCNVMLGRIQEKYFPHLFGSGDEPIDVDIVKVLFKRLSDEIREATGDDRRPEQVAEGFLKVAVENMAEAIKRISIQRGHDVTEYALSCFGGAGGQHACKVADSLGMRTIILHPYAGVLSAYGLGLSDRTMMREVTIEKVLSDDIVTELHQTALKMAGECAYSLSRGEDNEPVSVSTAHLKYVGTDSSLPIPLGTREEMIERFQEVHRGRFSFIREGRDLMIDALSVEVVFKASEEAGYEEIGGIAPPEEITLFEDGISVKAVAFHREDLSVGDVLDGPALIIEPTSTTVVDRGWSGEVLQDGNLILKRVGEVERELAIGTDVDPVMLEIFNSLYTSIAGQMGYTLQNTAHSVNIKERLDFSCAIFDGAGDLVANAPHIPVHLGSMSESVRTVISDFGGMMEEGDAFLLNSPYKGGTHLPDVTVVSPVFIGGKGPVFYGASRGHHADIGGKTPGSMPPNSSTIDDEGVIAGGMRVVHRGIMDEVRLKEWLTGGPYPARSVDQNLADIAAQVAANGVAGSELKKMVDHYSLETVSAYMQHVKENAKEAVRGVIDTLSDGSFTYEMDDGARISVSIRIDPEKRRALIDFEETSTQRDNNFNAPPAVCRACVLYVFRCLVEREIPLNEGCLEPLDIRIPKGCMLNPNEGAAVVAGNVETSQYIVDALFGALGVIGGSQGTMNNLTFGNGKHQYYETICGGAGGGDGFDGASGVHTHMTNSRITDPEVLESRFPVVLEEFSIRKGSGGGGLNRGGDGVVRRIRFKEGMTAAILSSHRKKGPFGVKGGERGAPGVNKVIRGNGEVELLPGCAVIEMGEGDRLEIRTPGGGGYGRIGG